MDGRIMRRALHISPNIYDNISSESSTKRIWIELSKEYDEYHILGRSRDCKYHFYQEGKLVLHTVPNLLNKTYPFFFTSFLSFWRICCCETFSKTSSYIGGNAWVLLF